MPNNTKYLALASRHNDKRTTYIMKEHILAFSPREGTNGEKDYCQVRLSDGSLFETATSLDHILSAMSE